VKFEMNYSSFAESIDIVEAEFLKRELGLSIKPFERLRNGYDATRSVIVILKSPSEILNEVLEIKESLIVFVLGDEKYQKEIFNKLCSKSNVKRVYTSYFPIKPRLSTILHMFIGTLLDGGLRFQAPAGGIWRTLINGYRKWKSTANFSKFSKVHQIPLGYTNRFVEELTSLGVIPINSNSIFEKAPLETLSRPTQEISFFGTRDSWCRDLAISHLQKAIDFEDKCGSISVDPKWGGGSKVGGNDYCSSIVDSRAVLCPPGYSSNFTFRFWESILLGAFPICLPISAQDWHLWQPARWNQRGYGFRAFSWRLQILGFGSDPSDEIHRRSLIASALTEAREQLEKTREFLAASQTA